MQQESDTMNAQIAAKQAVVQLDLSLAEPAIEEAKKSVLGIKKVHLTELKSLLNPPEAVKVTMEAICIFLGHTIDSWKSVQSVLRRDDFISSIISFNGSLTAATRAKLQDSLNNPLFNVEAVNRASKACGPIVLWIEAQLHYQHILEKVTPLRAQVQLLEKEAAVSAEKAVTIAAIVAELEAKIEAMKEEYAELIAQTQECKLLLDTVSKRVSRSSN